VHGLSHKALNLVKLFFSSILQAFFSAFEDTFGFKYCA
jgi:hypothetical protein